MSLPKPRVFSKVISALQADEQDVIAYVVNHSAARSRVLLSLPGERARMRRSGEWCRAGSADNTSAMG